MGQHTCEANSFQCLTGHCIPKRWVCDGDDDCQDDSDEDPKLCGEFTCCWEVLPQASWRSVAHLTFICCCSNGVVLFLQRESNATAFSAPTTPASQPLHTAMVSRSAPMALMSTTAVSDYRLILLFFLLLRNSLHSSNVEWNMLDNVLQ